MKRGEKKEKKKKKKRELNLQEIFLDLATHHI
jgi:hypothetical protein